MSSSCLHPSWFRLLASGGLLFLAACSGGEPADAPVQEDPPAQAPASAETVPADSGPAAPPAMAGVGLEDAREPLPGVITSAQPTMNQLESLVEDGYTRFISLRPADEQGAGWEEGYVTGQDISFTRIPIAGAAGLTRENAQALDRALDAAGGEAVVVYCASSNRVGALLALRAHWLEGASPEEALELGRAAGLRSLEPAVRELLGLN